MIPTSPRCFATRALLVFAFALAPALAHAQISGQYTGAEPLPVNGRLFGAYLRTSDNTLAATGQLRLSFYPGVDFGFQAGLSRLNSDEHSDRTALHFGFDVKGLILRQEGTRRFSAAFGGAVALDNADQMSVLRIAPELIVSTRVPLSGNMVLTPYGSLLLGIERSTLFGESETDVTVPLRLGVELAVAPSLRFVVEPQFIAGSKIDDSFQLVAGANFPF